MDVSPETPRPEPQAAPALRAAGDAARDHRDWAGAEQQYRAYLAAEPKDAAIWVQLGHALKEQGRLDHAEAAYRQAAGLRPAEADTQLQLGHLYKLAGRRQEALAAYTEALRLAPLQAAHDEMAALGDGSTAGTMLAEWRARKPADCLYLEITDLFVYLHDHRTVSGIQRVQLGLVAHVLALPPAERERYAFVLRHGEDVDLWLLESARVAALVQYLGGPVVERSVLDRLLAAAEAGATKAQPLPGQGLVVLGAFWVGGSVAPCYARAKAAGLAIGCYIYDLIPITHPEFCEAGLAADFARALGEGMAFFDFLLAISAHTAREMCHWLARQGLEHIPVETVPLAHDFRLPGQVALHESPLGPQRWPPAIAALQGRDYVLCVCTIEARKNHAYLFQLWKQLLDQEVEMPDLVLVGRFGWRVGDLYAQMQATRFLDGRIRVLHDLTDAELAMLYRHCLFTVFPSFVEGWGLPVGESLSYGKVCIASDASSLPEVGGALADYIDPLNLRSGLERVRHYVTDRTALARREAEIHEQFRPRGWAEVGEQFFATARRLLATSPRPAPVPLLRQGELFRPAQLAEQEGLPNPDAALRPLRLVLANGWLSPLPAGALANPKAEAAVLRFRTDAPAGAELLLFLRLRVEEPASTTLLALRPSLGESRQLRPARVRAGLAGTARSLNLRLRARADAEGLVEVTLSLPEVPGVKPPKRRPRLLLQVLAHAAFDNLPARLELLETLLLESEA